MDEQTFPFTQMGYSAFNSEAMPYCGNSPGRLFYWLFFMHLLPLNTAQHSLKVFNQLLGRRSKYHGFKNQSCYTTAVIPHQDIFLDFNRGVEKQRTSPLTRELLCHLGQLARGQCVHALWSRVPHPHTISLPKHLLQLLIPELPLDTVTSAKHPWAPWTPASSEQHKEAAVAIQNLMMRREKGKKAKYSKGEN